jgi:hypothetical protein
MAQTVVPPTPRSTGARTERIPDPLAQNVVGPPLAADAVRRHRERHPGAYAASPSAPVETRFVHLGPYRDKGVNLAPGEPEPTPSKPDPALYQPGVVSIVGAPPAASAVQREREARGEAMDAALSDPGKSVQVRSSSAHSFANFATDARGEAMGLPAWANRPPSPYE